MATHLQASNLIIAKSYPGPVYTLKEHRHSLYFMLYRLTEDHGSVERKSFYPSNPLCMVHNRPTWICAISLAGVNPSRSWVNDEAG